MFIPDTHRIWQLRLCATPSISARHSKHTPIPHKGPRRSPLTEVRQLAPAIIMAAATLVPRVTATGDPFTVTAMRSGMGVLHASSAGRQVRFPGNSGGCTHQLIRHQPRRGEGGRDSQTLMSGCKENRRVFRPGTYER